MTTNPGSREAAYADLVAGLIDVRVDAASERFDVELETAEASGRLDPATARLLRWWQRESVRAVTEHARTTIPTTLVALERAASEARDAVNRADAAWTTARGVTARAAFDEGHAPGTPPTPPSPPSPPFDEPGPAPWTPPPPPADAVPVPTAPAQPAPAAQQPPAAPTYPPTLEPPGYPSDPPAPTTAPTAMTYESAIDEQPAIVDLTDPPRTDPSGDATPPEGRRRTLLAGLTVLPRSD